MKVVKTVVCLVVLVLTGFGASSGMAAGDDEQVCSDNGCGQVSVRPDYDGPSGHFDFTVTNRCPERICCSVKFIANCGSNIFDNGVRNASVFVNNVNAFSSKTLSYGPCTISDARRNRVSVRVTGMDCFTCKY